MDSKCKTSSRYFLIPKIKHTAYRFDSMDSYTSNIAKMISMVHIVGTASIAKYNLFRCISNVDTVLRFLLNKKPLH